ncbi:MAG: hypothetical protein HKN47_20835 [Pirellulaceae bacterium]|nr:hypothetical protein [Pirellulaceae bacterium]
MPPEPTPQPERRETGQPEQRESGQPERRESGQPEQRESGQPEQRVNASRDTLRRLLVQWTIGAVVGTMLIAITSPLFVRSYLPLHADQTRGVWTLPPQTQYRWRSEGYAQSRIGPHGMPGRADFPVSEKATSQKATIRVALWGDSQAEGVVVSDHDKLFAQAERIGRDSQQPLTVLPLARSGEDAGDWLTQIPRIESQWDIDFHVILVVDLSDVQAASEAPRPPPSDADVRQAESAIARYAPAFVISAARMLLTQADESTPRTLRFSLGRAKPPRKESPAPPPMPNSIDWEPAVNAIAATAKRPVLLLYAPRHPNIFYGRVITQDPQSSEFERLKRTALAHGLLVEDTREALATSVQSGEWPHGFHNGQIGVGHLNATGYQVVAQALVDAVTQAAGNPR